MTLQTYTTRARVAASAARTSGTRTLGMTLVYRLPGPSTTRSAAAIAAIACGTPRGASGVSHTRRGRRAEAVIVLSPLT